MQMGRQRKLPHDWTIQVIIKNLCDYLCCPIVLKLNARPDEIRLRLGTNLVQLSQQPCVTQVLPGLRHREVDFVVEGGGERGREREGGGDTRQRGSM